MGSNGSDAPRMKSRKDPPEHNRGTTSPAKPPLRTSTPPPQKKTKSACLKSTRTVVAAIVGALTFVATVGTVLAWAVAAWFLQPVVSRPYSDPGDQFSVPFSISNPNYPTLPKATFACLIEEMTVDIGQTKVKLQKGKLSRSSLAPVDLRYGGPPVQFLCEFGRSISFVGAPRVHSLIVAVSVDYEVHLIPGLSRKHDESPFTMYRTSDGKPQWVEGRPMKTMEGSKQ